MKEIEIKNFIIKDYNDGKYNFQNVKDSRIKDYNGILEIVKDFKTIWDFLWLYNAAGIYAVLSKRYKGERNYNEKEYDVTIEFSMFGTCLESNNSEVIIEDTGAYITGCTGSWVDKEDIYIIDKSYYDKEDYHSDLVTFYSEKFKKTLF